MSKIFFNVQGTGQPVILIHGFPMNSAVWNEFAATISENFKVYTPDLPGFGKSESLSSPFSIDDVATQLLLWIEEQKIQNPVVIGHSLGGYVTLAMAAKNLNLFAGIGLFHSTAYSDSTEKKESRTKTIDFVKKNGALAFTSNFIQQLFANPEHPAIARIREIAIQSSEDTVTGYTQAMRDRPARVEVLQQFDKPVLLIAGKKDQSIPAASVEEQAALCKKPVLHVLNDVAHMGMFEKFTETVNLVKVFVNHL
ncbi:alpha/beta fold hydrolase [Ohtaekwangia koreensis]|uniref:Pimeloyl-ACP methyl ester carboxylesterase n=1 Tax=Ohtaekwangia koreensis TaxID=688867 RepID=A0A1T5LHW2_9BACT|nr:alpha/beta hydrolase [Ohtaekwangia koreensis]SKC75570.1 Pimeloyl-ACP methyl ester carboxylesterase [Ohtaekwangia koreensis]